MWHGLSQPSPRWPYYVSIDTVETKYDGQKDLGDLGQNSVAPAVEKLIQTKIPGQKLIFDMKNELLLYEV